MASFSEAVNSHIKAALRDLYTTMPGIVEAVKVVDGVTVIDGNNPPLIANTPQHPSTPAL